MDGIKDIIVKVIPSSVANPFVIKNHYSGKVVQNSCLHFGAFLNGHLHGVLSYGPSMCKSVMLGLVKGTKWNEFLELNRMAFDSYLPKNSESRCIGISLRLIKKNAPHIKWIVSFADGCQCGDGTIYRASNFVLTDIKVNNGLRIDPKDGSVKARMSVTAHDPSRAREFYKWELLKGFQLRYIYFLDQTARERLTVPILPFSRIDEIGAGMYQGKKITRAERHEVGAQGSELNRRITRGTDAS